MIGDVRNAYPFESLLAECLTTFLNSVCSLFGKILAKSVSFVKRTRCKEEKLHISPTKFWIWGDMGLNGVTKNFLHGGARIRGKGGGVPPSPPYQLTLGAQPKMTGNDEVEKKYHE